MGRDAYPVASLLALWDYSAEPHVLDFARQTATALLATQSDDGGFSGQGGCGRVTGLSSLPSPNDIHFGSGCLAPIALLEWAARDSRWPKTFVPALQRWAQLVLSQENPTGGWSVGGPKSGNPQYTLTGATLAFSLIRASQLLGGEELGKSLSAPIGRFLRMLEERHECVTGTHAFILPLYAHVTDSVPLNE
jgi:hypothetical protein